MKTIHYKEILKNEYEKRKARNPQFSMRAYAQLLGIDQAHFYRVLSGDKAISKDLAKRIVNKLEVTPLQQRFFLEMVDYHNSIKKSQLQKSQERFSEMDQNRVEVGDFAGVNKWYCSAIISLCELDDFSLSLESVSRRLNISEELAFDGLKRLLKAGFLDYEDGIYTERKGNYQVDSQVSPQEVISDYHKEMFSLATNSIGEDFENSHYCNTTFSLSKQSLSLVKEEIDRFVKDMRLFLKSLELKNSKKDQVLNMGVCLFRLDQERQQL